MTEERKRYLASISREERAIREHLYLLKCNITWYKRFLCVDKLDKCAKEDIRFTKILIKALRKQLPVPVQCMSNKFIVKTFCAVCKGKICDEENYCPTCGQKLR